MTTREEVYKLYKDFVELYKELYSKVDSYRCDYSVAMNDVLKVFRGYGGSDLRDGLSNFFESTIKEFNEAHDDLEFSGELDDNGCVLVARISPDFDKKLRKGLGTFGFYMVGSFNDDEETFNYLVLSYMIKSKLEDVTESEWTDLKHEFENALNYNDVW